MSFDTEFETDALRDLVNYFGYGITVISPTDTVRNRVSVRALIEWNETSSDRAAGRGERSSGRVGIPADLSVTTRHTVNVEGEGVYVISAVLATQGGQTPCLISRKRQDVQTGSREVL